MQVLDTIDSAEIDRLRAAGEFFWLDLMHPTTAQVEELASMLSLHEILVEDLEHFDQRPKLDDYENCLHIVFYGVERDALVEVHLVVHGEMLVTLRHDDCASLLGARKRIEGLDPTAEEYAVYRVIDALTDSYFPLLERLEDEIDGLEDRVVRADREFDIGAVVALRRRLADLRRVVGPMRDMLAGAGDFMDRVPGLRSDVAHDYYRDVYDHLLRIGDSLETFRDVLTSLHDLFLSAQSNRLNVVVYRLTVVGTIFLPITFITGFFGQNFGWLVRNIHSFGAFLGLGIGLELVAVVSLLAWFRRAGVRD
ncbi:MAG TPA: magnesium transporter CorA family protein [Solirubrobacteraceae bacterium]|nr:magnesium transporter CorA family protein [Solirubrobacteraceae bacterium]